MTKGIFANKKVKQQTRLLPTNYNVWILFLYQFFPSFSLFFRGFSFKFLMDLVETINQNNLCSFFLVDIFLVFSMWILVFPSFGHASGD